MGIPIQAEHDDRDGWLLVTPWPLTPKAFQNWCVKAHAFYAQLLADFRKFGRHEDVARTERALRSLSENKIRAITDSSMIGEFGLKEEDHQRENYEFGFPGTRHIQVE